MRAAVVAAVFLVYLLAFGRNAFQPRTFNLDFVAFYCAGETAQRGYDPYLTEPLRTCEHRVGTSFRKGSVLVLPAPLPPYDVAAFRLVSFVPFAVAQWLWFGLGLAAVCGSIALVARATRCPLVLVTCAMGLSLGYVSIMLGQIAPFSIFGILVLADALAADAALLAFGGTLLASCEPHLALAGVLGALAAGSWRVRIGTLAAGAVLGALSVVGVSFAACVEYVARVLPLHALSEINNREQFSLAYYLHRLGASETWSVRIAEIGYAVAMIAGVALARRLATTYGPRMAVLGPVAFGLCAGPFLHVTQMAAAVPAALVAWSRDRARLPGLAVLLLAIPWIQFAPLVIVAPLAIFAAAELGKRLLEWPWLRTALVAFAGLCACAAMAYVLGAAPRRLLYATRATAGSLAETSWRESVDLADTGLDGIYLIAKLPAHAGVIVLLVSLVATTLRADARERSRTFSGALLSRER